MVKWHTGLLKFGNEIKIKYRWKSEIKIRYRYKDKAKLLAGRWRHFGERKGKVSSLLPTFTFLLFSATFTSLQFEPRFKQVVQVFQYFTDNI